MPLLAEKGHRRPTPPHFSSLRCPCEQGGWSLLRPAAAPSHDGLFKPTSRGDTSSDNWEDAGLACRSTPPDVAARYALARRPPSSMLSISGSRRSVYGAGFGIRLRTVLGYVALVAWRLSAFGLRTLL